NNVNAVGPIVPTAGQNYSNSTNPISAVVPSNTNTSLQDASQRLTMLEREDIAYSDHENIGVESDFNNLEPSITKVWILVDLPHGKRAIDTKWIYRNKKDERSIVVRNIARLVAQGHTQEEGIDYEEVFAPVERIKAIRLFLAYASFMGFMVYQMDVKSAFLYGTIEEGVCVCQPPGFEDPDHPNKVYKVVKALYGLHQAPRAWYETLASYLLENDFYIGHMDQTLFIKKQKGDILLVQIYVKQKEDGIFISQDKYVAEILKKFRLTKGKSAITPIDTEKPLLKDPDGEDVDVHIYRSMIGSLKYLTSSRPDIMFTFWNTAAVKQSNDVTRLQALVDKKKVVVTEAAIRDALHLYDAEGVDCLPNKKIFTTLARMGRKFNFSKYIFESLVRNVVSSSKVYMYPRVGKGCSWVETPLFDGMLVVREPEEQGDTEEQGNDDNAAEEPVTVVSEDDVEDQSIQSPLPILHHHNNLKIYHPHHKHNLLHHNHNLQPQLKHRGSSRSRDYKVKNNGEVAGEVQQGRIIDELDKDKGAVLMSEKEEKETEEVQDITGNAQVEGRQAEIYQINIDHAAKVLSMQDDEPKIQDAVEVVTTVKLIIEVIAAVSETVSAAAVVPAAVTETVSAAAVVPIVTAVPIKSKDKGKGIMVEEPKPMKKKQQVKLDEAYARKLHKELNQYIDWEVSMDHVKQKAKDNPYVQRYQTMKKRPQTEAQARRNMMMYLKNTTGFRMDYFKGMSYIEEEENRAIASINETLAQKAAKSRRLNEECEDVEDLKQHLEIVPDEDDDIYTEATPLSRKVPVMDYQIVHFNNKPHYKIIRADETHQLYVSFITLLKNFDREDLESLWSIVKERFFTSKPNNFSDDFLLTTLKAMFGRPDGQDQVWMNQRSVHGQAKVKSWKLLESCGVHIVALTTTQLIMLVERRYPLSRFTLD
nr:hypothetical protein [Tanacetum cinerariifolium]